MCDFQMRIESIKILIKLWSVKYSVNFFQDLELASGMALGIRSPIPLGAVATQLYRIVQSRGYGQKDFSYVFQLLKDDANKK